MPLQFTPYIFVSGITLAILIGLAVAIWRRRPGTGAVPLFVMLIGVAIWITGNAGSITMVPLTAKKIATIFAYLGITLVPPSWLAFVLEYTGRERWLTRRNILLLAIHPILIQIVTITSDFHKLFWTKRVLENNGGLVFMTTAYGPLFWVHSAYSYILLLVGSILLISAFIRSPQVYRGQMFWMLVAIVSPWVANALFILRISPLPDYIDPTPLAFTITVLAMSCSVFRYQLTDLVPVARDIVVEGISDAVIVLDRGYRIVDANPAALKLVDQPLKAVMGQSLGAFLSDRPDLVEKYRTVEQAEAEIDLKLGESPLRTYAMRLSPLRNRRGTLVGRVIVLHDITELKSAREKAEESNRLKTQFLTTMSHELRTPLHAIHGFTELILAGIAGEINDLQRKNLERVMVNTDNLNEMIDDLLDLSKIESGRIELVKEEFEVKTWFDGLVQQTKKLAEEKGLRYVTTLDGLPDQIIGDPGRLRQIATNLICNAVKFTEEGEVRVTIKREGDDLWQIIVTDTGIGITPEAQEYIFDRFRQVDASPTRRYGGSGLGLSIVRDLAMLMGGGVRVKSEVGKGSTFSVILPLITAES